MRPFALGKITLVARSALLPGPTIAPSLSASAVVLAPARGDSCRPVPSRPSRASWKARAPWPPSPCPSARPRGLPSPRRRRRSSCSVRRPCVRGAPSRSGARAASPARPCSGSRPPRSALARWKITFGFALGVVLLQVGQPIHLLQHADALVALLEERVEVGRLAAEGGVLEDRGEVARLALSAGAHARSEVALLHLGSLDDVALGGPWVGRRSRARRLGPWVFPLRPRARRRSWAGFLGERDRRRHARSRPAASGSGMNRPRAAPDAG